jgi:type IV secretory pathway TrbF-like protein
MLMKRKERVDPYIADATQRSASAGSSRSANPYLNARREWDERYGDQISRAYSWRLVAMLSLLVAAIAIAGVVYMGAQSKIEPMVVVLDSLGSPLALAHPTKGAAVAEKIMEAQVANWVYNARAVVPDASFQKVLIGRVYAMASSNVARYLNTQYAVHPPFDDGAVDVLITSVLPTTSSAYQVNWNETVRKDATPSTTTQWKALISTGIDPKLAASPRTSLLNPLGIYIKSVTWTKVIG